jgi:hypothetical protein
MANKRILSGVLVMLLGILGLIVTGCASVKPMDSETMTKYGLQANRDRFMNYQYFVSRDIVLTATETAQQMDVSRGRAFSSTEIHDDVLQLLASTKGKCIDYSIDYGTYRLGIEFDEGSNNLLWFRFNTDDDCFYLDYSNPSKEEIRYADKTYNISYEEAKGIGAIFKRLITLKKTKDDYQEMRPLLLYEENVRQKKTETRRTLGGSRL